MKIGILGGTFDPIHQGHLVLARTAKKQFQLDKILFVPAFIPPHKTSRRDLTPAPYRYRMVELAIRKEPDFEISHAELDRPDISYTVDTLRALQKKYPGAELFLILGVDALKQFPGWHEPEEIRRLAVFLVAPRDSGEKRSPEKGSLLERDVKWIDMPICPLSSSKIRQEIREGKAVGDALPEGVEAYIRRMKLYSGNLPCPSS